jgi:hypothetical protein
VLSEQIEIQLVWPPVTICRVGAAAVMERALCFRSHMYSPPDIEIQPNKIVEIHAAISTKLD